MRCCGTHPKTSSSSARVDWRRFQSSWTMSRVSELVSATLSADAMADRLLDRQARLLEYLSRAATVFGDRADAPGDPVPEGLDRTPLRLQARFACNKRLEKIVAVFPRT